MTTNPDVATDSDWGDERRREITWHDPMIGASVVKQRSGLEHLQALLDGELPPAPIAQTLGFTLSKISPGEATFTYAPDESGYNPIGAVHGGVMCTLLDSAIGCAVHTTLPAGVAYTSIEIKISYLRGVSKDSGELVAHGWVTKPGRRVAFADADLRDSAGKVVATATGSCLIMAD